MNNVNLVELTAQELRTIDGGKRMPKIDWGKVWDRIDKALSAISIADSIDRFMTGWNSHSCK